MSGTTEMKRLVCATHFRVSLFMAALFLACYSESIQIWDIYDTLSELNDFMPKNHHRLNIWRVHTFPVATHEGVTSVREQVSYTSIHLFRFELSKDKIPLLHILCFILYVVDVFLPPTQKHFSCFRHESE